jgi:O-antigen/teichoic acid export membrane protein
VSLALVHRITIVLALALAVLYAAWGISQGDVLAIAGGGVVAVALAAYLRTMRAWLDRARRG